MFSVLPPICIWRIWEKLKKKADKNKKQGDRLPFMRILHSIIIGTLIFLIIASGARIGGDYVEDMRIFQEHESFAGRAREEAQSPVDFPWLKQQNPDTVAWIYIPGTAVDYPIVQASDNDTYLTHDFYGTENPEGTIFLDFQGSPSLDGRNNVIYGHNMKRGTMFRDVERFKDPEYFKNHQYFQIYTPERTICLRAVACGFLNNTPEIRQQQFEDDASYEAYIRQMISVCPFAQMPQEPVESLYTLVTCSYETKDARTVLWAVEIAK